MIQTYFEKHGELSDLKEEERFLRQVESETNMTLKIIGRSSLGRPILRCDLGNPDGPTMMSVFSAHSNEVMAREAAQKWVRDLAYSEDPEVLDFLNTHHVVVIPTVNPDGVATSPRRRSTQTGADPNRDWFSLIEPEIRSIRKVITEVRPVLITDVHEYSVSNPSHVVGYHSGPSDNRLENPPIRDITDALEAYVIPYMEDEGFVSEPFGSLQTSSAVGTLTASGWMTNIPTVLIETVTGMPQSMRADSVVSYHYGALNFLKNNEVFIRNKQSSAVSASLSGESDLFIHGKNANGTYSRPVSIPDPGSYTISEGVDLPTELIDAFDIQVNGRTVSTSQEARGVVGTLFDPDSFHYFENHFRPPALPVKGRGRVRINGALMDDIQLNFDPDFGV